MDTPVWSLALRRDPARLNSEEKAIVEEWTDLVKAGDAGIIGPIRQEVLSGVRHDGDFEALRERLEGFVDLVLAREDYEQAARFYNRCRARGIAAAHVDLLICAAADRHGLPIFTMDKDFKGYAKVLPIRLHAPRARKA